jgi:hypothetical protein
MHNESAVPKVAGNGADAGIGKTSSSRRSQRVCLNVEVEISLQRTNGNGPAEHAKTLIVSGHGALLSLQMPVSIGDLINLRHLMTKQELVCRVADVTVGSTGAREVGVEFLVPDRNFWHIAFPPVDWSPRGPESKTHGPQVEASMGKGSKTR